MYENCRAGADVWGLWHKMVKMEVLDWQRQNTEECHEQGKRWKQRKMKAGGSSMDREGEGDGAIQDEIWGKARKS